MSMPASATAPRSTAQAASPRSPVATAGNSIAEPCSRESGNPESHASTLAILDRSEEHTSELQSLMRISYAVFCLQKKKTETHNTKEQATNTSHRIHS